MPRGRRKSESPKEREAIYLEPDLRAWAMERAVENGKTFSQYTCDLLRFERTKYRAALTRQKREEE